MNRETFLKRLIARYPKFFDPYEKIQVWIDDYKLILPDSIDYTEINRRMILNYNDVFKPPSPADVNKIRLEIQQEKNQESKKYVPFADGVPPTQEFKDLEKKLFRLSKSKTILTEG